MRNFIFLFFLFSVNSCFSQLTDNFLRGNFTTAPVWVGSSNGNDFKVAEGKLQSNSTKANANFYLSTPNKLALNCIWEFWCNLKFNTSNANYVDIYLVSDKSDLSSSLIYGYFLRIGGTEDAISLFKRSGLASSAVKIIVGEPGITNYSNNILKILVSRTEEGMFTIKYDKSGTGKQYVHGGEKIDVSYVNTSFFGIYIQQSTSSFFEKHYFTDFSIKTIEPDTIFPYVIKITPLDSNQLELKFSEDVIAGIAMNRENYHIAGVYPQNVFKVSDDTFKLHFDAKFSNGQQVIHISKIKDLAGNSLKDTTSIFSYIYPYKGVFKDLIFNEIYVDPSHSNGLPDLEYVELLNRTDQYILLKNWKYGNATRTLTLLPDTIAPHQIVILCAATSKKNFESYGKSIGVSSWPILNNEKGTLILQNEFGELIDEISYTKAWYKDSKKEKGGYSLELINPSSKCISVQNWQASVDLLGGTPGKANSVYLSDQNFYSPNLIKAEILDSLNIRIVFDQAIDSLQASDIKNYYLDYKDDLIQSVRLKGLFFEEVLLVLKVPLMRNKSYNFTIKGIRNCAGKTIKKDLNVILLFPELMKRGDLLISEILFNPHKESVTYLEIYNKSNKILDLRELRVSNTESVLKFVQIKNAQSESVYLYPNTYWVLTSKPEVLRNTYRIKNTNFSEMILPTFKIQSGTVALSTSNGLLEVFNYHESMHAAIFQNVKGVALERVSFFEDANLKGNFQSASTDSGYGTPGYLNSVATTNKPDKPFKLTNKNLNQLNVVEKQIQMEYQFEKAGNIGSITILNDQGVVQKKLVKNYYLGSKGAFFWDGLNDYGKYCLPGIYVVIFNVFNLSGRNQVFKELCVVLPNKW